MTSPIDEVGLYTDADLVVVSPAPTAVQAFAAVMADVSAVGKDGEFRSNTANYNFRGIDGVMNAVGPALRKHGVVIVPTVLDAQYREVEVGAKRTLSRECTVKVRYRVYGPAGDFFDGEVYGEALDSSDKGTAKATSVAYRIFLLQSLTIPTHEPDPDESRYERASIQQQEDPAVPGLRSSIKAAIGKLDDARKDALKAWFHEQRMPKVEVLTADQCDRVLDHLMSLPEIDPGEADDREVSAPVEGLDTSPGSSPEEDA